MNELKAKIFSLGKDYPEICEWWRARATEGWKWVPCENLPPTGVVIFDDEHKYAAGWVYLSASAIAKMDWIVANPKAPIKKRKDALILLVDSLKKVGFGMGATNIFTSVNNSNLIELYEGCGFTVTETGMTNLVCGVSK